MNTRTAGSVGLTRLILQALFSLVVGIFVSICTLVVQALVVISGRRASKSETPYANEAAHEFGCSICQRQISQQRGEVTSDDAMRAPKSMAS